MAIKHSFKVREAAGKPQHEVSVNVPTYAEATEVQRKAAWEKGIRTIVIDVQAPLRTAIGKGMKGADLDREAQTRFDAALNGTKVSAPSVVVDATALGLDRTQIDQLVAAGATVVNIPAKLAGK